MPQMSPIMWTPIMILTLLMISIIKTNLYFKKEKKKKL